MQSFGFLSRKAFARFVLVACIASGAAACQQQTGPGNLSIAQPRGASVAFESIDGLPRSQFDTLVNRLNDEAQSRQLAVASRETPSAFRVKGNITATVNRGETTIGWTWDVFDSTGQNRVFQIKGEEIAKERIKKADDAWKLADEAMLKRIAEASMAQLGTFLISPEAAPNLATASAPAPLPTLAFGDTSPEAAGIYRIRADADPKPAETPSAKPGA